MLAKLLAPLTSLTYLQLTSGSNEITFGDCPKNVPQLPSVKVLSLALSFETHSRLDELCMDKIFPKLELLRIWNWSQFECSHCREMFSVHAGTQMLSTLCKKLLVKRFLNNDAIQRIYVNDELVFEHL